MWSNIIHPVSVRRFPSFRTQPLENLSHYLWTNGFESSPAPGENLLSGNLVLETGCIARKGAQPFLITHINIQHVSPCGNDFERERGRTIHGNPLMHLKRLQSNTNGCGLSAQGGCPAAVSACTVIIIVIIISIITYIHIHIYIYIYIYIYTSWYIISLASGCMILLAWLRGPPGGSRRETRSRKHYDNSTDSSTIKLIVLLIACCSLGWAPEHTHVTICVYTNTIHVHTNTHVKLHWKSPVSVHRKLPVASRNRMHHNVADYGIISYYIIYIHITCVYIHICIYNMCIYTNIIIVIAIMIIMIIV